MNDDLIIARNQQDFYEVEPDVNGAAFDAAKARKEFVGGTGVQEAQKQTPPLSLKKPFDMSDITHKRIDRYRPEYIAKGGENLVYGLPDYPDYVAKVDIQSVIDSVQRDLRDGKSINQQSVSEEERLKLEVGLQQENERYKLLQQYFGKDHVLEQTKHRLKVPVSQDLLTQMFNARHKQLPEIQNHWADEVWATVTLQQIALEIGTPMQYGIVAGYEETDKRPKPENYQDVYNYVTDSLVLHPDQQHTVREDQLLVLHKYLYPVLQEIKVNPQAKEVLTDFVQKAIKYTQETGGVLDLGSNDNVTFYQDEKGMWNYRLVDPVHSFQVGDQVSKMKDVIAKIETGEATDLDFHALHGPVNYTRAVNGLAQQIGLHEYIHMFPDNAQVFPNLLREGMMNAKC